jgi:uncharacterized membrane protein
VAGLLQALLVVAYPLLVYAAYTQLETRGVALALAALWGGVLWLRARGRLRALLPLLRQHALLALCLAAGFASGRRGVLLALPAFVSLYLLATFAVSLRRGPPMVERFARLFEADLPEWKRPYCRKVTLLWCVFLAANAGCIALLALAAPFGWWVAYTGGIFYALFGALMLCEYAVRKLWFRDYGAGPVDRLLARAFPAERTANGRRTLAWAAAHRMRGGPLSRTSA